MDDQPEPPRTPGPFAHLAHKSLAERDAKILAFNDAQRRKGSRKRWHDYFSEEAANEEQQRPHP